MVSRFGVILIGSVLRVVWLSEVVSRARVVLSDGVVALAFLIATVIKLLARMAQLMIEAVIICFFIYLELLLVNFFIPRVVRITRGSAKMRRGGRKRGTTTMLMMAPRARSIQMELTRPAFE